jgi:hypothetical protein
MDSVLILALPKSGTTILYQIIKDSMPPETIGLFEPETCRPDRKVREAGSGVCAKVLLTQARGLEHYAPAQCEYYNKRIMIVRDPRDVIVSLFLYLLFHSVVLADLEKYVRLVGAIMAKERYPDRISFLDLVRLRDHLESNVFPRPLLYTLNEMNFMRLVSRSHGAGLFQVNYRDIIDRRLGALETYLGFPLSETREVDEKFKRVERTMGYGDWKNWFLAEDVDFFRPRLRKYMDELGLPDDWDVPQRPVLRRENGSEYVMKLARQAGIMDSIRLGEDAFEPALELSLGGDPKQSMEAIPGLRPAGRTEGPVPDAVLGEPRLVAPGGETVNLLRRGGRYDCVFSVKAPASAGPMYFRVSFRRREVRLGMTLETPPVEWADGPAGTGGSQDISLAFICALSPGVYLVDIMAVENTESGLKVWEHLERGAAFVVIHDIPEISLV